MELNDTQLRQGLNPAQWEAVSYCDGPSLVIAGAGSGKTRVLTYKIAYLLAHGVPPWAILALTFTNKAAREMTGRIAELVGGEASRGLWAGTFHSIFARILRREAHEGVTPFTSNFTIYDTADSRNLLKTIIKERGLDDKVYKPAAVQGRISDAKNRLVLPEAYAADSNLLAADKRDGRPDTWKLYTEYRRRCLQADALDFDDLLLETFLLFRNNADVMARYRDRFRYILVDEYQDTNYAQYKIISQLAPPEACLCVVGDDAQSIYGFRGAQIGNILSFQTNYPTARLIKLERNYRSTQRIVGAANSIIAHNQGRIPKEVYSEEGEGERLKVISAFSDKEESLKIAREIRRLHRHEHVPFNEIAVLYRTNAQSRSFEENFRQTNIPYRIYGGLSFYQRKEIKDIIAYLRLACNPADEEALVRVVNYPARGIGATTLTKLRQAAVREETALWNVLCAPANYGVSVNRGTQSKLMAFANLVLSFRQRIANIDAYTLTTAVVKESGIEADLRADNSPENLSRRENVEELLNSIADYQQQQREEAGQELTTIIDYLPQVSLLTDQDQHDDGQPRVTLMTIHTAKGLEYDSVFVTGLEDELFPSASARFSNAEMEEERRLFYVAVTRAKTHCTLSYATSRWRYGQLEHALPSPFLDEIDPQYVERDAGAADEGFTPFRQRHKTFNAWEPDKRPTASWRSNNAPAATPRPTPTLAAGSWRRLKPASVPTASAAPASAQATPALNPGTRIVHERFGRGTVVAIEGAGANAKATVAFEVTGTKTLLLKFAKFTIE